MTEAVIQAERIGKKYLIDHRHGRGPYKSLRDTVASHTTSFGRSLAETLRGQPRPIRSSREDFWALRDISFEIKCGEVVGIVGRNGAGKSTLLKVISRITEPSEGRVTIRGRVASLLEVGTGFHPELTGRENIYLNGAVLGMARSEVARKFEQIVAFAEVDKFLDTPVKRYSSGMYVRLAFAVAAHLEPEILIVDEVLAVGDAEFQKKCLGKMRDAVGLGRTVLFVSHNLTAVQSLCSRCIVLDRGGVNIDARVDEALARYRTLSLADVGKSSQRVRSHSGTISLQGCKIICQDITYSGRISVKTDFIIQIGFTIEAEVDTLHLTIHLLNNDKIVIFSTFCRPRFFRRGSFLADCSIPKLLLNEGFHHVDLLFYKNGIVELLRAENALTFEVVDDLPRETSWMGLEPGVIRPRLNWDVRSEDSGPRKYFNDQQN